MGVLTWHRQIPQHGQKAFFHFEPIPGTANGHLPIGISRLSAVLTSPQDAVTKLPAQGYGTRPRRIADPECNRADTTDHLAHWRPTPGFWPLISFWQPFG